jgi:hypothetical protein
MRPSRLLLLATAACSVAAVTVPSVAIADTSPGGGDRTFATNAVDTKELNVAEPSINVAPDGAIYIAGPAGFGGLRAPIQAPDQLADQQSGGDMLWRSDDGGQTWKYLQSYDGTFGGGDSDVTSAPNGTIYASGLDLACVTVAASIDRGEHWVNNPAGCTTQAGLDDRQWNDVDGNQAVVTAFGGLVGLAFIRSVVSTGAVVNGPTIFADGGDDYQWPGVVAVDQRNGTSYLAWNTDDDDNNDCDSATTGCDPMSAQHTDDIRIVAFPRGATSSPNFVNVATDRDDTFDAFVDVDVDKAGNVYVVWNERHPDVQETWTVLSTSQDGGQTWSEPVKVNSTPKTTAFPWVSAGDDGRIAVSYYGTDATGLSPEVLAGNPDWYVFSSYSTDGGQTFSEYQTTPNSLHQGKVCTSGTGCATGTRDLLDFFETDYDADGCLVTAYADNSRDTVSPTGQRTSDKNTIVSFARQTSGPGLLADTSCGAPTAQLAEVPSTALLGAIAAVVLAAAYAIRRRRHGVPI